MTYMFGNCEHLISGISICLRGFSYGLPSLPRTTPLGKGLEGSLVLAESSVELEAFANCAKTFPWPSGITEQLC